MAFGLYEVPGGDAIATHIAASDIQQHTLILGSTGSGKSSLLELLARYHLNEKRPFTLIDLHGDLFTASPRGRSSSARRASCSSTSRGRTSCPDGTR